MDPHAKDFLSLEIEIQKDPRNSLFIDFVRFVKILKPKFFVMENVKGFIIYDN